MGDYDAFSSPVSKDDPYAAFSSVAQKPSSVVDAIRAIPGGLAQGITGLVGLPGDVSHMLDVGMDKLTGGHVADRKPVTRITSGELNDAVSKLFGGYYEPKTTLGDYAQTAAQFASSAIAGPEGAIPKIASVLVPAAASEALGQATKGTRLEPWARFAGAVGGGALAGAGSGVASRLSGGGPESIVPTTADLKTTSGDLYKSSIGGGEDSNFIVSKDALGRLRDNVKQTLADEGFKPQLHPATASTLDDIETLAGDNATLKGIEGTRRVANLGARNFGSADGYLASKVRNSIDDFLDNLSPSDVIGDANPNAVSDLQDARANWAKAQRSAIVDSKLNRAELSAQNFSASGKENAIRTQFRNLANNPKLMAKFTSDEQDAITNVAKGTKMGNLLRAGGRFAVRGPVSAMGNQIIGGALGGPAGQIALGSIGEASRMAATNSTEKAAQYASELVRGGPELAAQQALIRRQALANALKYAAPGVVATAPSLLGGN